MKGRISIGRLLASACVLALAALAYALYTRMPVVPDRWNPWTPLRVAEVPNLLTRFKLSRLVHDASACRDALAEAGFRHALLPDRVTGPGCGFINAVRIEAAGVAVGAPFSLSCPAAVALALWERHGLQPAAQAHYGRRVARIEHFGSYACRNVYGRRVGARSRHATADALDIAGFVLADGHRIRVLRDWTGSSADSRFLHDVGERACRYFDTVLGPDYNAAHRDHLHFGRGGFPACR